MRVVIFGAGGPAGRLPTTRTLADGHDGVAVIRHLAQVPPRSGPSTRTGLPDAETTEGGDGDLYEHTRALSTPEADQDPGEEGDADSERAA